MKFLVKTLPKAESDIRSIFHYLYQRSQQGATAWLAALDKARIRLETQAQGCSEAMENGHFNIELKQSLFKTRRGRVYRLVFTIVNNEVRILRVRGAGQAPVEPEGN